MMASKWPTEGLRGLKIGPRVLRLRVDLRGVVSYRHVHEYVTLFEVTLEDSRPCGPHNGIENGDCAKHNMEVHMNVMEW